MKLTGKFVTLFLIRLIKFESARQIIAASLLTTKVVKLHYSA